MNESILIKGRLEQALRGVPDSLPVHLYITEEALQGYLEDRYWRHIPKWGRWLLRRWDVTYISGMSVIATDARVVPCRDWRDPFYVEIGTQVTQLRDSNISAERQLSSGRLIEGGRV